MGLLSKSINLLSYFIGQSFFDKVQAIKSMLLTYSIGRKLKRKGKNFCVSYPIIIYDAKFISVGDNVYFGNNSKIRAISKYENKSYNPKLIIGNNCRINNYFSCYVIDKVELRDNVFTADNVYISDTTHGFLDFSDIETPPAERDLFSKGPVLIEENVWIGKNVCVLANVTIGRNSIIGANSVVTHDIPPYSIAAGSPARVIKTLKSNETKV